MVEKYKIKKAVYSSKRNRQNLKFYFSITFLYILAWKP